MLTFANCSALTLSQNANFLSFPLESFPLIKSEKSIRSVVAEKTCHSKRKKNFFNRLSLNF